MSVVKKYHKTVQAINSFDFSGLDDADLVEAVNRLKADRMSALPELFAIVREVIDRRLGIWKLFDDTEGAHASAPLQRACDIVREKRGTVDDSQIHLEASFYRSVREMRQSGDGLTFWPYDVQLMGALALCEGKIAEMGTGEGKTVVAVFPACLWALSGKKVHIATVNDYLALRDCEWMEPVFRFMGLDVDCVLSHTPDAERRQAYKADVVYGNNYEFGFDYLRDNVKNNLKNRVQSKLEYVIIDEVDSILMDEATTPLIISSAPEERGNSYWKLKPTVELLLEKQSELVEQLFGEMEAEVDSQMRSIKLVQIAKADPWDAGLLDYFSKNKNAVKGMRSVQSKFVAARSEYKLEEKLFYVVDERSRTVNLTEQGMELVERELGSGFMILEEISEKIPPGPPLQGGKIGERGTEELRNFMQLLRAYVLHWKDEDYIVSNGGITIVDEFTGRLAFGKKYEEGLHQAIECKEGLQITPENRVVGRITHPNYFRLYEKMVGMTATAHTEAEEFKRLYKLEVIRVPTNEPVIREDLPDRFYRTEEEKLEGIIDEIEEYHNLEKPVLVGTRSVEKSERLSALLGQRGISHNVLNARNHAQEAEIIRDAGQPHVVTIATNMAGRGTDIALGDPKLGLHVIGSERHSARRIDHQLRGRSGRQGDPGSSRFHLSLQDELFRVFGRGEMSAMVKAFERGHNADKMSALPGLARLVRRAQRTSEETSYDIRKRLIQRDDVTDKQRKTIYRMRQEALASDWTKERVQSLIADYMQDIVDSDELVDEASLTELRTRCMNDFGVRIPKLDSVISMEEIKEAIAEAFGKTYDRRESVLGTEFSGKLGRAAMLEALETSWADYLSFQSEFDRSMSLRSYVKGSTLADYRLESTRLFEDLLASVRQESLKDIFTYPLPGEKTDSVHWARSPKPISKQIEELVH